MESGSSLKFVLVKVAIAAASRILYVSLTKLRSTMLLVVIDEELTITTVQQILAVGKNHTFLKHIAKIFLYPQQLVTPGCGIAPRSC